MTSPSYFLAIQRALFPDAEAQARRTQAELQALIELLAPAVAVECEVTTNGDRS